MCFFFQSLRIIDRWRWSHVERLAEWRSHNVGVFNAILEVQRQSSISPLSEVRHFAAPRPAQRELLNEDALVGAQQDVRSNGLINPIA